MKKNIRLYLLFFFSLFLLTSCGKLNENSSLGEVIWTIVGWIALVGVIEAIFDLIFNFFAIKFPYIYFPSCLAFALVLFFKISKGNFAMFGLDFGIYLAHGILLFLIIPRFEDFVQHYTRITYEYDITFGEFRETSREDIKKTISGICVKLGTVAVLLLVFFVLPTLIYKDNDPSFASWMKYAPLIVEGGYCGIFSLLGFYRLIKYHG
ncbi:MAG: hypothetical protein J1F32_04720 [Erysipelotrichales bacterium]|nr:hypothetical protein [Erysipelotrichales bacterium]